MGEPLQTDPNSDEIWQLRVTTVIPSSAECTVSYATSPLIDVRVNKHLEISSTRVSNNLISSDSKSLTDDNHLGRSVVSGIRQTFSQLTESSHQLFAKLKSDPALLDCSVTLLNGQAISFSLQKSAVGLDLFRLVTSHLDIEEPWYFGLSYFPNEEPSSDIGETSSRYSSTFRSLACESAHLKPFRDASQSTQRRKIRKRTPFILPRRRSHYLNDVPFWLKLNRRIVDQCGTSPCCFYFEVKYYVVDPERSISCPSARYQYCLQLRQHLISGRLSCSFYAHVLIGALIAQIELGDSHPRHSARTSLANFPLSPGSSRMFSGNTSAESRSVYSSRTCSLASPEVSDDSDVDIWNRPTSPSTQISHTKSKCFTASPASWTPEPSSVIGGTSAHLTRLDVLPHLQYRSRSADARFFAASVTSTSKQSHSFGPNWPYPSPILRQCPALLRRIARLHQRLRGWPRSKAEYCFLRNVRRFALYGIELHIVKQFTSALCSRRKPRPFSMLSRSSWYFCLRSQYCDRRKSISFSKDTSSLPHSSEDYSPRYDFSLGVSANGLLLLWGQVRLGYFPWTHILSVSAHRSHCLVIVDNATSTPPHEKSLFRRYDFTFSSASLCLRFFQSFVDYHRYFRLGIRTCTPNSQPGSRQHAHSLEHCVLTDAACHPSEPLTTSRAFRSQSVERTVTGAKWLRCWYANPDKPDQGSCASSLPSVLNGTSQPAIVHIPCSIDQSGPGSLEMPDCSISDDGVLSDPVWVRSSRSLPRYLPASSTPNSGHIRPVTAQPYLGSQEIIDIAPLSDSISHCDSDQPGFEIPHSPVLASFPSEVPPCIRIPGQSGGAKEAVIPGRTSLVDSHFSESTATFLTVCDNGGPSSRPTPPPRPKLPACLAIDCLSTIHEYTVNPPSWNIPLVSTHSCVVDEDGRLVRLSADGINRRDSSTVTQCAPYRSGTSSGLSSLPLIPTRAFRYPSTPVEVNRYLILNTAVIHLVQGDHVPVIPTKSTYVRYP